MSSADDVVGSASGGAEDSPVGATGRLAHQESAAGHMRPRHMAVGGRSHPVANGQGHPATVTTERGGEGQGPPASAATPPTRPSPSDDDGVPPDTGASDAACPASAPAEGGHAVPSSVDLPPSLSALADALWQELLAERADSAGGDRPPLSKVPEKKAKRIPKGLTAKLAAMDERAARRTAGAYGRADGRPAATSAADSVAGDAPHASAAATGTAPSGAGASVRPSEPPATSGADRSASDKEPPLATSAAAGQATDEATPTDAGRATDGVAPAAAGEAAEETAPSPVDEADGSIEPPSPDSAATSAPGVSDDAPGPVKVSVRTASGASPVQDGPAPAARRRHRGLVIVLLLFVACAAFAAWRTLPTRKADTVASPASDGAHAVDMGDVVADGELSSCRCRTKLTGEALGQTREAAAALDGSVIAPDARISLLDTFDVAGVDAESEGAQVVATALYVASLEAGLEVAERHAGKTVAPWAPVGLDAFVGAAVGDLVIANPLGSAVRVVASADGGGVSVSLHGAGGGTGWEATSRVIDLLTYAAKEAFDDPASEGFDPDDEVGFAVVESRLAPRGSGRAADSTLVSVDVYRVEDAGRALG